MNDHGTSPGRHPPGDWIEIAHDETKLASAHSLPASCLSRKAEGTRLLNAGRFSGAAAKYAEALAVGKPIIGRGALPPGEAGEPRAPQARRPRRRGALRRDVRQSPPRRRGALPRRRGVAFAARRYEAPSKPTLARGLAPATIRLAKRVHRAREAVSGFYFHGVPGRRHRRVRPSKTRRRANLHRGATDAKLRLPRRRRANPRRRRRVLRHVDGTSRRRERRYDRRRRRRQQLQVPSSSVASLHISLRRAARHQGTVVARFFHFANVPSALPRRGRRRDLAEVRRAPGERPSRRSASGELLTVGRVRLDFTHTPGHSPGSMVVFVDGNQPGRPGNGAGILVSGDTIFPGSCGRLDLPDADAGRALLDSLARCARVYGDDVVVYPGHNYNGASSISGWERRRPRGCSGRSPRRSGWPCTGSEIHNRGSGDGCAGRDGDVDEEKESTYFIATGSHRRS